MDLSLIGKIIYRIVSAKEFTSGPTHETFENILCGVYEGASGYLYALLVIEKDLTNKKGLNPAKVKDLLIVLHTAILEVVDLLVSECVKPEKEQIHNMSAHHNIFIHGV